ncbi:MAG: carbonic anhydrase [Desulfobulbaceae bacterium]|nr:carbonic anhydrase [Desulfobulbaceae bacterium]HIJ77872.1 carbonic anhydrase [Deltaproteobacteria bacterium]
MKKIYPAKKMLLSLACAVSLACTPAAFASDHGANEAQTDKTPTKTIKAALEGNDQFRYDHRDKHFEPFQDGQVPNLTVVSCSDSRVHTQLFGIQPDNNIFIIRNVGNQVTNSEGSVDYGVRHLPTKILLIMGHSGCGAVKAAMGDYSGETSGIKAELDPLKPVIDADDHQGDFSVRLGKNVERNVDFQVKAAMELYADKLKDDQMVIVGGVYDFQNLYGKGRGTLVITNVNGVTDINKIIAHPVMESIYKGTVVNHVGSLAPAL